MHINAIPIPSLSNDVWADAKKIQNDTVKRQDLHNLGLDAANTLQNKIVK